MFVWLIFEQTADFAKVRLLFIYLFHSNCKKHEQDLKPMHISVRCVKSKFCIVFTQLFLGHN
nr:MAG TPA: hypothetical protein [Caudoviricetes sp.]